MIGLPPPGTWCSNQAILELIWEHKISSFVDVGCGGGLLSALLCE